MSVDLAWKIARLFDISLYALLETDLSLPQDNNSFLTDFMQKLIYDTENAKAIWENRGGVCCYLDDYVLRTGLFDDNQSESSDRAMRYQPPRVSAGRYFDVSDDTFSFPITDDGRELLIVPYQFSETQKHFDFIFYWPVSDHHNIDGPTLWELAFTTIDNPMGHLADTAQALYNAIERLQFDAKITQDTKQIFSEYLKG